MTAESPEAAPGAAIGAAGASRRQRFDSAAQRESSKMPNLETVSIIIPTLNEARRLPAAVANPMAEPGVEVIVVDGGSDDGTLQVASELGLRAVSSPKGRAVQMNLGAQLTAGSILIFLHADTRLPKGFAEEVRRTLRTPGTVGGAFSLRIDANVWSLRVIERAVNWRSRYLHLPYGDQALFLTRTAFEQLGGYQEFPLMEDFDFIQRLRKLGAIRILSMDAVSSARRWKKLGPWKTTLLNQFIICAFQLGVSPSRLARIYHGKGSFEAASSEVENHSTASVPETRRL